MTEKDIRPKWDRHSGDCLPEEELDRAFTDVMLAADNVERLRADSSRNPFRRRLRVFSAVAAAVAAIVLIPWLTLKINADISGGDGASAPRFCEVSTRYGETRDIVLPDGTQVKLNAGSFIVYPETFLKSERSVYVSGEAVFRVTHDPSVPFIVGTGDMDITVHGTTFNVKSYPGDRTVSTTLCEGSISASIRDGEREILLKPDSRLSYDRETGESSLSTVNSDEDTAWERGGLCFCSENIHDILNTLERMYGINTYLAQGKYDDVVLTAKFLHGESLPQMLEAICRLVPGLRYSIDGTNVYMK